LERTALRRVAVLGPNAAVARTLGGGSATVFPPYTVSPLDGLRAALGSDVVVDHAVGVRAHSRIPAAAPGLLRHPDGGEGVEVRFLGPEGAVLGRERRTVAAFNWALRVRPDLPLSDVTAVEVATRLRAGTAGKYVVGCSGVGRFRLTVADGVVFDGTLDLPPGADPVEGLMAPPQWTMPVVLGSGDEVDLRLTYEIGPGSGSFELTSAAFALNAESPHGSDEDGLKGAVAAARDADVAVVVVGTTEEVESEGFDRT